MTPFDTLQARKRERRHDIIMAAGYALVGAAVLAFFQWVGI